MGITRKRVLLLLCAVIVLFILGFAGWQLEEQRHLGLMYKKASTEMCQTVDKLVDLRGEKLANLSSDYANWDDMVAFVKTRDPKWAEINLVTGMDTYGADVIGVYNPSGVKVYSAGSGENTSLPFPDFKPEQIKHLFSAGPLCHFFLQTRSGLVEVRGATIVPSADSKRAGPTHGYFLASQIWDSSHLNGIASLVAGKATLQSVSAGSEMKPGERKQNVIVYRNVLCGLDGSRLQTLCVSKRFDQGYIHRTTSRKTTILLGLFAGVMLVVLALGTSRFVMRPLGLIAGAMQTQSPETLSSLENDPSEFGQLAKMIHLFFLQRADLENEVRERSLAEADIKKSEEYLSTTLNSIGDAVITTDADGRIVRMNPVAETMTGWILSEAINHPISEVLKIENALTNEPVSIPLNEVLSTGKVCHIADNTTLISRDGARSQIADSAAPIHDAFGVVIGMVLVFADITERKQAEEALRTSEEQFRSLFEDSREAMQTLEPPSWLYASCNQATLDLFGAKDKEEFLAVDPSDVSPETQPDGRASDEKAMEMVETAIREGSHSFEWMYKRMNGETFPATVLISRLEREGRVYIQVTVRDITERKQAERRQHLSADILRILNEPIELTDSINKILTAIKLETGFDAVGLRLKNGDDFPYFVQHGFSDSFLLAENTLVALDKKGGACRDKDGNISLECTCGLVLSGQTDPTHPLFTPNGSCWTNNSLPLLDLPADQDPRLHPRNRCIHDGFLSVAMVPIHANREIVGLLQLNDRKADRLTLDMVQHFEEIAANIGLALMKKQSDEELRSSRAFLNNSMNAVADPIFVKDEKRRFVLVNDALCDIVGRSREQLIGEDGDDMFPSDQVEVFRKMDDAILDTGEENVNEESLTDLSDDSVNTIVTRKTRYVDPDGKRFIVGVIRDITERKRMEDALKNEKDNLAAIFASSPVGMLLLDEDTMIVNANSVIAGMVSRNLESIVHQRGGGGLGCVHSLENEKGCGFASVCPDCTLRQGITQVLKTGTSIRGAEIQVALLIDGQEHHQWLRVSAEPVTINGCKHVVVAVDDITEQKQAEEELRQANAEIDKVNRQLEYALLAANQHAIEIEVAKDQVEEDAVAMDYQAHHDSLTSLPNRKLFSKELTKHVSDRRRKRKQFAVLFIDLDKFKIVNDTLGHKAGDSVLVETAARLSSCLREGDILARMGGDEFTVMLRNTKSKDDAAMVAQRMIEQVSVPFKFGEHKMVIGASVGVSIYPENATDADGLLKTADAAMYKAKESGRNNCQFFSEEIRQKYHSRLEIERDLNLAVEQKTLVVQYQPIIDVETMQVVGAEAMLLWNHQDKGLVSPSLFIPVAEENGLILPMNKMVMETACQQCKKWQDMGYSDFEISVAVSTAQLNDIKFIAEVEAALSAVGLSQHCLILQVTESILEQSSDDKAEMLRFLKAFGVRICLDDFGVGYSSLSKLKDVPIAHLKVNGFFTSNVDRNRNDRAMTESIIGMAHNLGIKVTAEGIEDVEQMATIKSLKCDYAQGDLISPALPQPEFEDFMRRAAMEAQRSAA